MRRTRKADQRFGLAVAPWLMAGAVFCGGSVLAAAQDGTPTAREVTSEPTEPAELASDTGEGAGGGTAPSSVPSAGVGAAFGGGGSGWLALGAGVGAAVAAAAALRERMTGR